MTGFLLKCLPVAFKPLSVYMCCCFGILVYTLSKVQHSSSRPLSVGFGEKAFVLHVPGTMHYAV